MIIIYRVDGYSLYIRPTAIATSPYLGVQVFFNVSICFIPKYFHFITHDIGCFSCESICDFITCWSILQGMFCLSNINIDMIKSFHVLYLLIDDIERFCAREIVC